MMGLLAQVVEPVKIVTDDSVVQSSVSQVPWPIIIAFTGAAVILAVTAIVARRIARQKAAPASAAWGELCEGLGLTGSRRVLIEKLAAEMEVSPAALALSRGAMERAVLMRSSAFSRTELQQACRVIWNDIEVPGAAGSLPTVTMPAMVARPRPRLRASA